MGTQKNRLNESVLSVSTQNMLKLKDKNIHVLTIRMFVYRKELRALRG